MYKPVFIIALCLVAALPSCDKNLQLQKATQPPPIDSFTVSGIDPGQQANNFQYINDSLLCSYDLINMELAFFRRDKTGNFKAGIKKAIDTEFWSVHFRGRDGKHYFADANNVITVYNPTVDTILKRYSIPHRFPYLKDSFALACANNSPVLVLHDTLISVISPNANESERLYYKEREIAEFRINPSSDTLSYIRSYIAKPARLSDYDYPLGMYCMHNNTVFLLYPQFDTIYSFNRSTNSLHKTAIHNQDFTQSAKFTCESFTPVYGSCATKYYLYNFRYYGICYNPLTRHFILLYHAPVADQKNRLPTFEDQPLRSIVLDEQLRPIKYHSFTKNLEAGGSFFMIPGKGLAMPLRREHYENTRFYIYNL